MATTATSLAAAVYRRKVSVQSDGGGGATQVISNAVLVAGLSPGPLLTLLSATYASQALARAAIRDSANAEVRLLCTEGTFASAPTVDVDVAATLPVLSVIIPGASQKVIVEVLWNRSASK